MENKTEYPTRERLLELRERGVIHQSPLASHLGSSLVVFGIIAFFWTSFRFPALNEYKEWAEFGVNVSLALLLGRVGGFILLHLLQTRFFVSFSQNAETTGFSPFRQGKEALWLLLLGIAAAGLIFWKALPLFFAGYAVQRGTPIVLLLQHIRKIFLFLAISTAIVAGAGYLVSRFRFLRAHRMSRQEVEQEQTSS